MDQIICFIKQLFLLDHSLLPFCYLHIQSEAVMPVKTAKSEPDI